MTRMWEIYFHNVRWLSDWSYVKVVAPNAKEAIYAAAKKSNRNIHQIESVKLVGDTATDRP